MAKTNKYPITSVIDLYPISQVLYTPNGCYNKVFFYNDSKIVWKALHSKELMFDIKIVKENYDNLTKGKTREG